MIERGQIRMMRDGEHVEVLEIVMRYDEYWKHDVPYVRLQSQSNGVVIERRQPTVESYPLLYTRRTTEPNEDEERWWLLDRPVLSHPDEDDAKIDAVMKAAGNAYCIGLVDEQAGGVVAYLHKDSAEEIVDKLNKED